MLKYLAPVEILIGSDSCAGQEAEFHYFLDGNKRVESHLGPFERTLIDGEENLELSNRLWVAFCGENNRMRDKLIAEYILSRYEDEEDYYLD